MDRWRLRARIYHWFRKVYPIRWFFQSECDRLEDLLDLLETPPERIVDLGTGLGETLSLLPQGKIRILLDHSHAMLKRARMGPADVRVIGDILSPPLKPGSFDLVTCIGTSEYIPEKALLLQEMYTLLKPGGYALVTFSPRNLYSRLRNLLGKRIYPLSGSTAYDLLAAEGFYIVRAYRTKMQSQYLVQKIV
ncbi:MAG TPA: class I SAM-dependent methyltransferase [Bacteroidetes bacterium]|nr:class I SAM-dependent methyltransferase [Bacteroidota bacterium]